MDVYKLKTTEWKARQIDRTRFENETVKLFPYYRRNSSGEESQFAVCPACNNPIQLIGLYPKKADQNRPFGRHVPHDVKGIAPYSHEAYIFCPYANPRKYDVSARKRSTGGLSNDILAILQEQFDRVIYLISKETGIVISEKLAQSMLEHYMGTQGYLYAGATLMNIPWMLAYLAGSASLFGRVIRKESELAQHILRYGEHSMFNERGQLVPQEGHFLDISFCFIGHQNTTENMALKESMDFVVTQVVNGQNKEIFRREIVFDHAYFQTLTCLPEGHARRNMKLVELARTVIQSFQ